MVFSSRLLTEGERVVVSTRAHPEALLGPLLTWASTTDRVSGCGTLVVSDASEHGRVVLHDIPRVEKVQLLVAEELHRLDRTDDGT